MFKEINEAHSSKNIVITGGLNLPNINWTTGNGNSRLDCDFLDCWNDMFVEQLVTEPTRRRELQTPSVLDLILTNFPESICNISHHPGVGKSDHEVIRFDLRMPVIETEEAPKLDYLRTNEPVFEYEMDTTNWFDMAMAPEQDMEAIGESFTARFKDIINLTVPFANTRTRNKAWFNNRLKRLYRKRGIGRRSKNLAPPNTGKSSRLRETISIHTKMRR